MGGMLMPVSVREGSGPKPFKIVEKATGKLVGASKTKEKATSAMKLRNAITEGGFRPRKRNPKKGQKELNLQ